jgi:hypothetical protein
MNKFRVLLLIVTLAVAYLREAAAQEDDVAEPVPVAADAVVELDAFRAALFGAFNDGDYETMLEQYCHPDVIATWQDGTSGQGYDAVLAEFEKLSKFIDKMTVQPDTDMRLVYGDGRMVVASGNMRDRYALARGIDVDLNSRWTATLVKEDDKWLLVSFSASTNAFQNEVISLYLRNTIYASAAIAAIVGVIVGSVGTWILARRQRS